MSVIIPPTEIIKEIIQFVNPFANCHNYSTLRLVCVKWKEYVQTLLIEKYNTELPKLAVTWATRDIIQIFKYTIEYEHQKADKAYLLPRKFGFLYEIDGLYNECYSIVVSGDKYSLCVKWDYNETYEMKIMKDKFWSRFYSNQLKLGNTYMVNIDYVIEWLKIWLPIYIFRYDFCAFRCYMVTGLSLEIYKIYKKYSDKHINMFPTWDCGFMCRDLLETIKAIPLDKFCKLLLKQ